MKLHEARSRVLAMMRADPRATAPVTIDEHGLKTKDAGKFLLNGKPARVILRFSGWFAYL